MLFHSTRRNLDRSRIGVARVLRFSPRPAP